MIKLPKPSQRAVVFDIDSTIADCSHRVHLANAKQWDDFHSMCPHDPVISPIADLMRYLSIMSNIVLCTGRNERYRHLTEQWLKDSGLWDCHDHLLMRPDYDYTHDHEMKIRLLEDAFGDKESVLARVWLVVDDRDTVVEGLRNYGLTVLQPCNGGF